MKLRDDDFDNETDDLWLRCQREHAGSVRVRRERISKGDDLVVGEVGCIADRSTGAVPPPRTA